MGRVVSPVSVLLFWTVILAAAQSSVIDLSVREMFGMQTDVPTMKALLLARSSYTSSSLDTAKRIIDDLSSSPSCAHAPTARLIRQCKLVSPKNQDSSATQQLDNAIYVYALSMSACEMQKAREVLPFRCQMFTDLVESPMGKRDVGIIPTSDIDSCLESIKEKHYYWTTYDNFRQQSYSLCDSSRIDHDREDLLAHYKQSLIVHSELLEALKAQRLDLEDTMTSFHAGAAALLQDHADLAHRSKEQGLEQERRAKSIAEKLISIRQSLADLQDQYHTAMTNGARQANQGLEHLHSKVDSFEHVIRGLMASAAEAATEVTNDVEIKLSKIFEDATMLHARIGELATESYITDLKTHLELSREAVAESSAMHTAQLTAQRVQIKLSEKALHALQQTGNKIEELSRMAEVIPDSWLSAISIVRARFAYLKTEIQWFAFCVPISALCWILHLPRTANIISILYIFSRSSAHIFADLSLNILQCSYLGYLQPNQDDIKTAVVYLLAAMAFAVMLSWCMSLFDAPRRTNVLRAHTRLLSELEKCRDAPLHMGRGLITPDRNTRAATSPPEFLS